MNARVRFFVEVGVLFALLNRLVPYLLPFFPNLIRFQFGLFFNLNFEVLADEI